jgi:hypothetical protein
LHVVELTDRVVSLCARKEVDGGVKVVLGYETILKLWAEELLCARAGVEGGFEPGEWDRDRHARLLFGGHVQVCRWRWCLGALLSFVSATHTHL